MSLDRPEGVTESVSPGLGRRQRAEEYLQALVGSPRATLREDQWTSIEALVVGRRRALVVQRTGWGKSAVYFVATALLREQGAGPTVIVSPLLALMRNQVAAAERAGIRAVTVNSTNPEEWAAIYGQVRAGDVDVLLVSPERLNNPGFRDQVLPDLARTAGLVVVDEAHCVSDWGHDFRPDYRRIRTLLADLPVGVPVLATTATANRRVTDDIAEQLSVSGAATLADVLVLRGELDRRSLHLGVLRFDDEPERLAWLADHLNDWDGSGIIYCLTVAATQDVAAYLRDAGHAALAYSGQADPADRFAAEDDLLRNRVKVLVATSALGMGFDKPDLGFVIHLGAPASPIAYYQQVGRAGRAMDSATVVLLPGREDRRIWEYFGSLAFPPEAEVRDAIGILTESGKPVSTAALEARVPLRRTRLEAMLKVLDVDGAVRRVRGGWEATGQEWSYDADRYRRVAQTRRVEQQAMLDYETTSGCRLEFLRRQLDDPAAAPCGRCDNCGGLKLPKDTSEGTRDAARQRLLRPGITVEPRRQWPAAMSSLGIDLTGRIGKGAQAEPGRAIARLNDLGWGSQLRDLFSPGSPDQEVPVALRHALVEVWNSWQWTAGAPTGVVGLDSATRPILVKHLLSGVSTFTRLPTLARFSITGEVPPGSGAVNSAQRLAAVSRRYTLSDRAGVLGQRVVLVDDIVDTGWTVTVASKLLLDAGAEAVYPLLLAAVS